MRILVVADEYPWPPRTGYRQRLGWILRVLATQGAVDFVAAVPDEARTSEPPPVDLRLARHAVLPAGARSERRLRRLGRWAAGSTPRALLWQDWAAPRALVADWADVGYDLVWFSHAPAYFALADLVAAPHVVDLDNLGSSVLHHRRRSLLHPRATSLGGLVTGWAHAAADAVDERRWHRLEHEVAEGGACIVVCSELDRRRLGRESVLVVPNGYERAPVTQPTDRRPDRSGCPLLIMVGLLTYAPNQDAAAFFAAQILPRVRRRYRNATFNLVGRYDPNAAVAALRRRPGVEVSGEVAEVAAELAAADIAVVPIRFGGGTRIKILEAFAYQIPVVSTTVGCEGLDVVDGKHLLIADDPAAFAAACVRLHEDADLRVRLVAAGTRLWESRYRWTVITPAIVGAVRTAVTADRPSQDHAPDQADQEGPNAASANQ